MSKKKKKGQSQRPMMFRGLVNSTDILVCIVKRIFND